MTVEHKIIPVNSTPARRFTTEFAGRQLIVRTYYNQTDGGWFADIYDQQNNPILIGAAIVTGVGIVYPYPDLGIGELAYITDDGSEGNGRDDLGVVGQLISRYEDNN